MCGSNKEHSSSSSSSTGESFAFTITNMTIVCRSQAWAATRAERRTLPVHEGPAQHRRTEASVTRPE